MVWNARVDSGMILLAHNRDFASLNHGYAYLNIIYKLYLSETIASISTNTSRGNLATCTVERAGVWLPKASP